MRPSSAATVTILVTDLADYFLEHSFVDEADKLFPGVTEREVKLDCTDDEDYEGSFYVIAEPNWVPEVLRKVRALQIKGQRIPRSLRTVAEIGW